VIALATDGQQQHTKDKFESKEDKVANEEDDEHGRAGDQIIEGIGEGMIPGLGGNTSAKGRTTQSAAEDMVNMGESCGRGGGGGGVRRE